MRETITTFLATIVYINQDYDCDEDIIIDNASIENSDIIDDDYIPAWELRRLVNSSVEDVFSGDSRFFIEHSDNDSYTDDYNSRVTGLVKVFNSDNIPRTYKYVAEGHKIEHDIEVSYELNVDKN